MLTEARHGRHRRIVQGCGRRLTMERSVDSLHRSLASPQDPSTHPTAALARGLAIARNRPGFCPNSRFSKGLLCLAT